MPIERNSQLKASSPRERGSSGHPRGDRADLWVVPARAGVIRCRART